MTDDRPKPTLPSEEPRAPRAARTRQRDETGAVGSFFAALTMLVKYGLLAAALLAVATWLIGGLASGDCSPV